MATRGIIISGLPCSGKSVLCERLHEEYKWPVRSIGQMWREKWKTEHPDGKISFEDYWRGTSDEDNQEVNRRMRLQMEENNLIVDSRYSAFYALDLPYLRVFLTADLDIRAVRGLERHKPKSLEQVKEILKTREKDEVKRGRVLFEEDYRNPSYYQLKLDSWRMSVSQELKEIKKAIASLG